MPHAQLFGLHSVKYVAHRQRLGLSTVIRLVSKVLWRVYGCLSAWWALGVFGKVCFAFYDVEH